MLYLWLVLPPRQTLYTLGQAISRLPPLPLQSMAMPEVLEAIKVLLNAGIVAYLWYTAQTTEQQQTTLVCYPWTVGTELSALCTHNPQGSKNPS